VDARRWWPDRRALVTDLALMGLAVVLEAGLLLHATYMHWDAVVPAVRMPVTIAVVLLRRRLPVLALALAAADAWIQQEVSAALPIAAYAMTRYQPRWSVRAPVLLVAAAVQVHALWERWGPHSAAVVCGCFVMWPATLGAYYAARVQLVAALLDRVDRAEAAHQLMAARAVLEERTRIAGEMHDVVGHRVSLMALHAGAVEMAADEPAKVRRLAEQMQAAGRQALTELRQVVGLLRTDDGPHAAPLQPQPRLSDLVDLVEDSRRAGMEVMLEPIGPTRPLPETVERTAYRVVQEALTNAGRHAPGGQVRVTLTFRPHDLAIAVINRPATRSPLTMPGDGHGLIGLRERIRAAGGRLHAQPRTDGGFAVEVVLPA
jgi:signal transduction histidine kinase